MTQDSKATQEHRTIMVDPSSQDFWRRQFPCPVELVRLPCDKPRPPVPSYLRDTVVLALNPSLNDALFELSSRLNVSPLAIFLAAFKIVLFRYSGQETLVVGVTAQTSKILADSRVNGHALLPIQSHWSAPSELSGQALVCELAQRLAEAAAHARYSIRELRSWAGAQDSAYGARLFSVAFCLAYDSQEDGQAWPMLNSESSEFLAQCDLTVTVMLTASSLILQGHFDTDLFEASTIQRLLGHIGMILEGIIRDPSVTVLRLPILTATERQELLVEWNGSNTQAPPSATLHELFEAQVERNPEALALTCEGHSLTYGELNQRANRLAHALRERGVGPEVMVAIYIDRSLELVIGMLGILKAGGAYLPIDLAYPKERIAFMLEDARAPLLLTQSKLAANLPLLKTQVVYLEDAELSDFQSYPTSNPSSGATTENLAYIMYTSGTTGLPKAALITHRNVARLFIATDRWYGFNSNDVWTLFHSCAFDFSVWEIWGGLLYGGRVIVVPFLMSRSPEAFYELLANEQVTVLSQTPSAFRQLIQAEQSVGKKDLTLRYVVFGGEALEMHSLRPWFERHGDPKSAAGQHVRNY